MEVISPPAEFYPDMTGLRKTLGNTASSIYYQSLTVELVLCTFSMQETTWSE
jgi:hypothetical protein